MKRINIYCNEDKLQKMGWKQTEITIDYEGKQYFISAGPQCLHQPFDIFYGKPPTNQRYIVQQYKENNPGSIIIDEFEAIDAMKSRSAIGEILEKNNIPQPFSKTVRSYEEMKSILENNSELKCPFIVKTIQAQGSYESHDMKIIKNIKAFEKVSYPCFVQQFINHNG